MGGTLRAHLTAALERDVFDVRLSGVVVTSVELPDDLSVAFISVRRLAAETSPLDQAALLRALERAAPRLRRLLGPRLRLRRVPELRFRYDTGQDAQARVEAILHEIRSERESEREGEGEGEGREDPERA